MHGRLFQVRLAQTILADKVSAEEDHSCNNRALAVPVYCAACYRSSYGVAIIRRLLKNIGLFCKRALQERPVFCNETYVFKEPTNRSHPILTSFVLVSESVCSPKLALSETKLSGKKPQLNCIKQSVLCHCCDKCVFSVPRTYLLWILYFFIHLTFLFLHSLLQFDTFRVIANKQSESRNSPMTDMIMIVSLTKNKTDPAPI